MIILHLNTNYGNTKLKKIKNPKVIPVEGDNVEIDLEDPTDDEKTFYGKVSKREIYYGRQETKIFVELEPFDKDWNK